MSEVKWCDINDPETNVKGQTGHSFSARDIGARTFTQTRMVPVATGNSYGTATYQNRTEVTEVIDICGYHFSKQNPFQTGDDTKAIEAESVEAERDMWRAKYEAATGQ